jgi:hypothetical protein
LDEIVSIYSTTDRFIALSHIEPYPFVISSIVGLRITVISTLVLMALIAIPMVYKGLEVFLIALKELFLC